MDPYDKGAKYAWKFGDGLNFDNAMKRCENEHPDINYHRSFDIVYPNYKDGYHSIGCCLCEYDNKKQ
jgi:hypothetical protein